MSGFDTGSTSASMFILGRKCTPNSLHLLIPGGTSSTNELYPWSTNKKKRLAWAKKHEQWMFDQWKSVLWSDESKFEIFGSNHHVFVRCRVGERMISACVVPIVKHRGGVMCVSALLVTLSVIYFEFKAHLTSMATTAFCSETQSHLVCAKWDYYLFFDRTVTHYTSRLCKGYSTNKSDGVLHQMTWPPQSPDLNSIELVWDELDRRLKEKHPTSAQHMWELLQDCWKSIPGEVG